MDPRISVSIVYAIAILALFLLFSFWQYWMAYGNKAVQDVSYLDWLRFSMAKMSYTNKEKQMMGNQGQLRAKYGGAEKIVLLFLIILSGGLLVIWTR